MGGAESPRCDVGSGPMGSDVGSDVGLVGADVGSDVLDVGSDVGSDGSRCRVNVGFVEADVGSDVLDLFMKSDPMSGFAKPMSGPMCAGGAECRIRHRFWQTRHRVRADVSRHEPTFKVGSIDFP